MFTDWLHGLTSMQLILFSTLLLVGIFVLQRRSKTRGWNWYQQHKPWIFLGLLGFLGLLMAIEGKWMMLIPLGAAGAAVWWNQTR